LFRFNLKNAREKAGLSQKELANKLCVASGAVGNWESGTRTPHLSTIHKIAEALNVSVFELVDGSTWGEMVNSDTEGVLTQKKDAPEEASFTEDDLRIAKLINSMPEDDKKFFLEMLTRLENKQRE
jgi:transcriptional regulator with XRE-family HTH domain